MSEKFYIICRNEDQLRQKNASRIVSLLVKKISYDNNKHYDEDDIDNNSN